MDIDLIIDIVLFVFAMLFSIAGVIFCIIPILPGQFVSYVGLIFICFLQKVPIEFSGIITIIVFAILTIGATIMDFALPSLMAKKFGGTNAGATGAFIGTILGIIIGLVVNIWGGIILLLLSPFFGALIGELIHDYKHIGRALKSAFGSFLSFFVGMGIKILVSIATIIYIIWIGIDYCIKVINI